MNFDLGDPPYSWQGFHRFVEHWVGPHKSEYMIPSEELAEQQLPEPLRHYLHWYGRWPDKDWGLKKGRSGLGSDYQIWVPDDSDVLRENIIRFGEGPSGVELFATHRTGEDPPVLFNTGVETDDPPFWHVEHDSLQTFLIRARILTMTTLGVRYQAPPEQQVERALELLEDAELLVEDKDHPDRATQSFFYADGIVIWERTPDPRSPTFYPGDIHLYARDQTTHDRHFA